MKVIFIMADTFRRDHMGAYGNKWIHTPNLDALAAKSTLFEHAYIGSFPTIPNRRDIILGIGDKNVPFNQWRQIDDDEVTLAERLKEKKVTSMLVTDTANSVTNGRNVYKGYTSWQFNRGQEGDPCWTDANVELVWPVAPHQIRYNADRWLQVLTNRAHRRVEEDWFAPGTYEIAIEWLNRNYQRDDFFLWVETFDPHEPWDPPQYYTDLYDPGFKGRVFDAPTYGVRKKIGMSDRELKNLRARYAGECTMVDACVGKLVAALERLGIADETMVIFTSDHGAYFDYPGDNGLICKPLTTGADGMCMSAGGPMKDPKQHRPAFTGVARIPLIIHLPGQSKGRRAKQIVQPWDLTPTVLEAFGIKKPGELIGHSLMPMCKGKSNGKRYAAVLGNNGMAQVMNPNWLYAVWPGGQRPKALIDLKKDPDQKKNLADKSPATCKRLHKEIVAALTNMGASEEFLAKFE